MKKNTNKKSHPFNNQWYYLIPSFIVLVIVPLIVRLKVENVPKDYLIWKSQDMVIISDLFSYYKGSLLMISALICIIIMFFTARKTWRYNDAFYNYSVYGYIILATFSLLFSVNKGLSLNGYFEHYENYFVLISYVVVFFFTAKHIIDEKQIKTLLYGWSITCIILFLIGLTQYLGKDIIMSDFGKSLILPNSNVNFEADTDFVRNVYQTLYHYNYVSFFAAIGFPFFLTLALTEKELKFKALFYTLTVMFLLNQFFSLSRNGFIGIFVGLIVCIVLLRKKFFEFWKVLIPLLLIVAIGFSFFIFKSNHPMAARIRIGLDNLSSNDERLLDSITAENNQLIIRHTNFAIVINHDFLDNQDNYTFFDINGNKLDAVYDETLNKYILNSIDSNILSFEFGSRNGQLIIVAQFDGINWLFGYENDQFVYINPDNTTSPIVKAESIGFQNHQSLASARGYIWSHTFPLIKDYFLFGSGPDTFAKVFPQEDYAEKHNFYYKPYHIVDKPHSIYLGYAVNTGIFSLIAVLLIWGYYLFDCFRLYIKTDIYNFYARVGIACNVAVIGYLVSGLFNDTNLSVTPTFWVILGLGYAVNRIMHERQGLTSKAKS